MRGKEACICEMSWLVERQSSVGSPSGGRKVSHALVAIAGGRPLPFHAPKRKGRRWRDSRTKTIAR